MTQLATKTGKQLDSLIARYTKQIISIQSDILARENKIKSLEQKILEAKRAKVEAAQKEAGNHQYELTKKGQMALASQTILSTPADKPYSSQEILRQAREQGII